MEANGAGKQGRVKQVEKILLNNKDIVLFLQDILLWNLPGLFLGVLGSFTFYYVSLFYSESTILSNLTLLVMFGLIGRFLYDISLASHKKQLKAAIVNFHKANVRKNVEPYSLSELAALAIKIEELPVQIVGYFDGIKSKSNSFFSGLLILISYGLSFLFDLFPGAIFFYLVGVLVLCAPRIYRSDYHIAFYKKTVDTILLADSFIPRAAAVSGNVQQRTLKDLQQMATEGITNASVALQEGYQQARHQIEHVKENLPQYIEQAQREVKEQTKAIAQDLQKQAEVLAHNVQQEVQEQLSNPENQKLLYEAAVNLAQTPTPTPTPAPAPAPQPEEAETN